MVHQENDDRAPKPFSKLVNAVAAFHDSSPAGRAQHATAPAAIQHLISRRPPQHRLNPSASSGQSTTLEIVNMA